MCFLAGRITFARMSVTRLHNETCLSFMFKDREKASDISQCHQCAVQGPSQGWDGREGSAGRGPAKFSPWELPQILWAWSGPWWLHCLQECWGSWSSFKVTKYKHYFILWISDILKEDGKVASVVSLPLWMGVCFTPVVPYIDWAKEIWHLILVQLCVLQQYIENSRKIRN